MLVLGALVAMVAIGVWLYSLVDIVLTPRSACRYLPKPIWLTIAALPVLAGSVAWLLFGRTAGGPVSPQWQHADRLFGSRSYDARLGQRTALARSRHPAGRARPIGPDDDPEFLLALDHLIRGGRDSGNDL